MLNQKEEELVLLLRKAEKNKQPIPPLTSVEPNLSMDQAYHIQLKNIELKMGDGQKITGKKIGLTSKAMQDLLGVDEPDYGHLTDDMKIANGGEVSLNRLMQPKIEGELAFILKEDLVGQNITLQDVLQATDVIVPALEIVDSRVKDWQITLTDTVADNASSGLYLLGNQSKKISDIDVKQIGMELYKNDELQNTGVGSAALGDPVKCVAWLANKLRTYDITLKAGEVILSGALSAAVEVEPGDQFRAEFTELGEVSVHFTE